MGATRSSAIPEGRRAFSSDKFRDKEIAEERMYFNKEDEKLLRGLLGKMKAQAECSDRTHKDKERSALVDIVGAYSMKSDDIEAPRLAPPHGFLKGPGCRTVSS